MVQFNFTLAQACSHYRYHYRYHYARQLKALPAVFNSFFSVAEYATFFSTWKDFVVTAVVHDL